MTVFSCYTNTFTVPCRDEIADRGGKCQIPQPALSNPHLRCVQLVICVFDGHPFERYCASKHTWLVQKETAKHRKD